MSVKKMTELSLLVAAALILYVVESWIPLPVAVPGVKLGLSNIITVMAVYRYKPAEVTALVAARVLLGSFFAGNMSALLFSAAGAVVCLIGMFMVCRILPVKYLAFCSVWGAICHNIGQMAMAVCIMKDFKVLAYLPVLMVTGCVAGLFTGLCGAMVLKRIPKKS